MRVHDSSCKRKLVYEPERDAYVSFYSIVSFISHNEHVNISYMLAQSQAG